MSFFLKQDVTVRDLHGTIARVIPVVETIYQLFDQTLVITSGTDGVHSSGSLHYKGKAIDCRTRFFSVNEKVAVRDMVAQALGDDYDVILERTHLHIEYDPE
jgi:hypothetical protein